MNEQPALPTLGPLNGKLRRIAPLIVFGAALAVRLGYLHGLHSSPFFSLFLLDPLWHDRWASQIAAGDVWGREVFFRAPLYPYFLALIYWLTDHGLLAVRLVQFTLGSLSAALVYYWGRELFEGTWPALIAGLAFAFYGPMIYFEGELLIVALIVFLDLAGLYFLHLAVKRPLSTIPLLLAGTALGLSIIARPNLIVPAAFLTVWLFFSDYRHLGVKGAIDRLVFFLFCLLVFSGLVMFRNGVKAGVWTPLPTQGGINFYVGNNAQSDGKTAAAPGGFYAGGDEYHDNVWASSVAMAERVAGRKLTPTEVSGFWYGKSLEWMKQHPLDFIRLMGRKLFFLLHGHEIYNNNVPYYFRNFSPVLAALMWDRGIAFPAGVLAPLAIIGMVLLVPPRKKWAVPLLFLLPYAATVLAYFVVARFRMPLVGPCILLAVGGLIQFRQILRERRYAAAASITVLFAALLTISNLNAFDVRKDDLSLPLSGMGIYYRLQGDQAQAEQYLKLALEQNPSDFMAMANLGGSALERGDLEAAEEWLRKAIKVEPNYAALHNNLGQVLEQKGDREGAWIEYAKAVSISPNDPRSRQNFERLNR